MGVGIPGSRSGEYPAPNGDVLVCLKISKEARVRGAEQAMTLAEARAETEL